MQTDSSKTDLATIYRGYIDCLNRQDWLSLGAFVADDVRHNGEPFGLSGYRRMLERDYRDIPDLRFKIALLVADATYVACRLDFDCTPIGTFLGLPVNGRRVRFSEHVFYEFRDGKIIDVRSILDKAAIESQF
ncbi:putative ester cyclase [Hartmannibacter diazotrophicus]|uniref:Putative ester cyclase n=1 Tax=Hartmannibacter diazotrophicus TaxID=1482074 RepID=A0A2C9D028_9HYPH|nr:ester cyclase [Hartmannibacter diazotrophicus]SON53583.1 putative ester cyclase [Hartmannibacter diazotrophicus]